MLVGHGAGNPRFCRRGSAESGAMPDDAAAPRQVGGEPIGRAAGPRRRLREPARDVCGQWQRIRAMNSPSERGRSGYVACMRPFPMLPAVLIAVLVASVAEVEGWLGDGAVLALLACLATALVAFNWWELWATRDDR
jgi:hypothetical protein